MTANSHTIQIRTSSPSRTGYVAICNICSATATGSRTSRQDALNAVTQATARHYQKAHCPKPPVTDPFAGL